MLPMMANDLEHYKEMQEWTQSDGSKFNFYDGLDLSKKLINYQMKK